MAKASFSISMYLHSVEVRVRKAYTIGNHFSFCCFGVGTATSPKDEASAATRVSASGFYRANTGCELKLTQMLAVGCQSRSTGS